MNKFFNTLAIAATALLALSACDNVNEDERLIYVKPAQVQRAVLIEDFTGQRCVNCPKASEAIEQLQEQYGDSVVIAVGVHSGPFAKSVTGTPYSLYTAEGDEYYKRAQAEEQPSGTVNRMKVSKYTDWGTQVYDEIQKTAPLSIDLQCRLDEDTRQLTVNTSLMGREGSVNGNLQLWVIEDGVVAFQYMPDNSINREYVHNHVLRRAINGTWGENVQLAEGQTVLRQAQVTLDENWVADNLSVVAFVYNDSGVLQAAKIKVKHANDNASE